MPRKKVASTSDAARVELPSTSPKLRVHITS
jgi:hypothetical protein